MNKSDSELSDFSDDDYTVDKTYEPDILEGKSSSEERDEEKHGNICNGKTILDHPFPSKSLETIHFIVLAVINFCFSTNKKIKMNLEKLFPAKFSPIFGSGHQHSLIDEVAFPSYLRHARLERDLARQGGV
ncbi:hypothetical protein TNCV_645231 [Trichonephila clavipes]|nr:hypothetical protein TNCV_645231 [Trichonephila clavipes]